MTTPRRTDIERDGICLGDDFCVSEHCAWEKPCGSCECRTFDAYFTDPEFVECPPNHGVLPNEK